MDSQVMGVKRFIRGRDCEKEDEEEYLKKLTSSLLNGVAQCSLRNTSMVKKKRRNVEET